MKIKKLEPSESDIQKTCVHWFRIQYQNMVLFAIPNEAKRSFALAAHMKGLGLLSGVPDLFLANSSYPFHGLFIEMKSGKGKLTEKQKEIGKKLKEAGYMVEVCHSLDEFMGVVKFYLKGDGHERL